MKDLDVIRVPVIKDINTFESDSLSMDIVTSEMREFYERELRKYRDDMFTDIQEILEKNYNPQVIIMGHVLFTAFKVIYGHLISSTENQTMLMGLPVILVDYDETILEVF